MARRDELIAELQRRQDLKSELASRNAPQQVTEATTQQPIQENGFINRLSQDFSKRGENFGKNLFIARDELSKAGLNPVDAFQAVQKIKRRSMGALAGGVADVAGEAVTSVVKTIGEALPKSIKDKSKEAALSLVMTEFGQESLDAIRGGAESYSKFKQENPQKAQDIEDIVNVVSLLPITKIGSAAGKTVEKVASTTAGATKKIGSELTTLVPQTAKNKELAQQLLLSESKESLPAVVADSIKNIKPKAIGGPESRELATLKIKPQTETEKLLRSDRVKAVTDKLAKKAVKQGFDPAVLQSVKLGSKADKLAGKKMVNIVEKTLDNAQFGLSNRPTDIVGDTLLKKFQVVKDINKKAGESIGRVVKSISKRPFDAQKIESSFVNDLSKMGIKLFQNDKGKFDLDFAGSQVQGIKQLENILKDVVKRMDETPFPTTGAAHDLKKFLDEKISFDKVNSGLQGKTETVLKKLRRNINNEIKDKSPRYGAVNKVFSETVDALDELQALAGKNNNILGDGGASMIGQKLRGIMSNNVSRVRLVKSYKDIERLANKFSKGKFTDSIERQVLLADELDKVIKPAGRTSLQGQMQQNSERAAMAAMSPTFAAAQETGKFADRLMGINEKGAIKAIKALLNE